MAVIISADLTSLRSVQATGFIRGKDVDCLPAGDAGLMI